MFDTIPFFVYTYYMIQKEQLTYADVAAILGVTRMTIYNRVKAGELPAEPDEMVRQTIREMEGDIEQIRKRYADIKAQAFLRTI